MKPLVQKTLDIALSQEGVREQGGDNRGPQVEAYLKSVGLGPGYPWCAAFIYWCVQQAAQQLNVSNPFLRSASTGAMKAWAIDHDILHNQPQEGDAFLRGNIVNGVFTPIHTGLITAVNGADFDTVEGNTNIDGSANGIGVFRRTRTTSNNYRFVRWNDLVDEPSNETYALFINDTKLLDMPVINGRSLCPVRPWAEFMGFSVEWNNSAQTLLFDGQEVNTQVVIIDDRAYAPIRDLVASAGLTLTVDTQARRVTVKA